MAVGGGQRAAAAEALFTRLLAVLVSALQQKTAASVTLKKINRNFNAKKTIIVSVYLNRYLTANDHIINDRRI